MSEQLITKREEVKSLLRKLFRSEDADLDFGIYRIMNYKRREIEQFIERDLIEMAETEFKQYARVGTVELEKELERLKAEINSNFGTRTIDSDGRVTRNHDAPKVQRYLRTQEEYRAAVLTEEQVNDVFNHIYEFFSRYYYDGDFITRPKDSWKSKYSIPYKGEEVTLHWATKNMYYVKTGEFFKKYSFKAGRYRVNFVLVDAQVETGNTKGEKKFFILSNEEPVQLDETANEVEIRFNYRELSDVEKAKYGTRNIQATLVSEILEKMRPLLEPSSIAGILRPRGGEEKSLMEKHLNSYVYRNTKDFFIHKDLKGFLERELDFYIKNEVWSLDELESSSESGARLLAAKVKTIRGISLKIIEFLSQIEEFQKKLFVKKKFVLKSNYIISLKSLANLLSEEDYVQIKNLVLENFFDNINYQLDVSNTIKEIYKQPLQKIYIDDVVFNESYIKLKYIKIFKNFDKAKTYADNNFNGRVDVIKERPDSEEFYVEYVSENRINHLNYDDIYIDTIYFNDEFKYKLLEKTGEKINIDDIIDGYAIKSDNYHYLNMFKTKYKDKINLMYIDPPFNTKGSGFLYKDNYLDSSWITMMWDRLELAKNFLTNDGGIYLHLDHNANYYGRFIMNGVFGDDNFFREITWNTSRVISGFKSIADNWIRQHDTILYYGKTPNRKYRKLWKLYKEKNKKAKENLGWLDLIGENEEKLYLEKYENFNPKITKQYVDNYNVMRIGDVWNDILSLIYTQIMTRENWGFFTQKPENLVRRIIQSSTEPGDFVMDFYAGTGTTLAAAHKLDRRWIGVEMGDQFEDSMLTRMKTVVFGDIRPFLSRDLNWSGGGIFQYLYLEQYEDTLNNIEFKQSDGSIQTRLDRLPDYFLTYMLEYETRDSPTRISFKQFKTPFNYKIKTLSGGEEQEEPVDLVETFNYLLGLHIKRIRTHKDGNRVYRAVFGERDYEQVAVIWRNTSDLDLRRDKSFIEENILADSTFDTIYVNGDSYVRSAKPIEPEFRRLMGA